MNDASSNEFKRKKWSVCIIWTFKKFLDRYFFQPNVVIPSLFKKKGLDNAVIKKVFSVKIGNRYENGIAVNTFISLRRKKVIQYTL